MKEKILFLLLGLLIVSVIGVAFYRSIVRENYFVFWEVACDPTVESCYLYTCDSLETETECSGDDVREAAYFYKNFQIKAFAMDRCGKDAEECFYASCENYPIETQCSELDCASSGMGNCYGPGMTPEEMEEYVIMNPQAVIESAVGNDVYGDMLDEDAYNDVTDTIQKKETE